MMFGAGFGGFGGFLALLFQVIVIGLILSWLFGRRRQPAGGGRRQCLALHGAPGLAAGWRLGAASGRSISRVAARRTAR